MPSTTWASAAPMKPNCTRCSARTSTLAPTSTIVTGCPGTGTGIASAGRWMPGGALDVEEGGGQRGAGRAAADEGVGVARGDGARGEDDRGVGVRAAGAHGVGRLGDGDGGIDDLDPLGHLAELLGGAEEHDAHPLLGCVRRARGDFCGPEVGAVGVDRDRDGHGLEATQSGG